MNKKKLKRQFVEDLNKEYKIKLDFENIEEVLEGRKPASERDIKDLITLYGRKFDFDLTFVDTNNEIKFKHEIPTIKKYDLSKVDLSEIKYFEDLFNGEILNARKYIRDLSKGNQKKVGIVGALIGNPEIIVLDEPFANLDPSTQIKLKNLIKVLSQNAEVTFLISSHDLAHTTEVCNRIVAINKGVVVKDISTNSETLKELEEYFASQVSL